MRPEGHPHWLCLACLVLPAAFRNFLMAVALTSLIAMGTTPRCIAFGCSHISCLARRRGMLDSFSLTAATRSVAPSHEAHTAG